MLEFTYCVLQFWYVLLVRWVLLIRARLLRAIILFTCPRLAMLTVLTVFLWLTYRRFCITVSWRWLINQQYTWLFFYNLFYNIISFFFHYVTEHILLLRGIRGLHPLLLFNWLLWLLWRLYSRLGLFQGRLFIGNWLWQYSHTNIVVMLNFWLSYISCSNCFWILVFTFLLWYLLFRQLYRLFYWLLLWLIFFVGYDYCDSSLCLMNRLGIILLFDSNWFFGSHMLLFCLRRLITYCNRHLCYPHWFLPLFIWQCFWWT